MKEGTDFSGKTKSSRSTLAYWRNCKISRLNGKALNPPRINVRFIMVRPPIIPRKPRKLTAFVNLN